MQFAFAGPAQVCAPEDIAREVFDFTQFVTGLRQISGKARICCTGICSPVYLH
jgi:hypothetical protein